MSNDTISSADLFADQQDEGLLSPSSASVLGQLATRIDLSMQTLSAPTTVTSQTVLGVLLDNSPSMNYVNRDKTVNPTGVSNADATIAGHNLVIEALTGAKAVNSIEMLSQLLNPDDPNYIKKVTGGSDVFKWSPLRVAPKLVSDGFVEGWATPLYDRALELLGSVVARTKWWEDEYGVQTTSRTLLMSDGESNTGRFGAADVRQLVEDMLAMEKHRIFFLGVRGADSSVDFNKIAADMGIPADCVGVVPSDPKAIRAWFQLFSQSATSDVAAPVDLSSVGFGQS
jgi:hypothetical protein